MDYNIAFNNYNSNPISLEHALEVKFALDEALLSIGDKIKNGRIFWFKKKKIINKIRLAREELFNRSEEHLKELGSRGFTKNTIDLLALARQVHNAFSQLPGPYFILPSLDYGLFNNYKNEELERIKSVAKEFYWKMGDTAMIDCIFNYIEQKK